MSTRAAEWCSLQPSVRSRDEAFPVTLLPLLPNEAVDESSSIIECSTLLNVSCLKGLKTRDGFNSLIDSYSRWIMTVTDQTHIAFLITEWEEGPVPKCAVVSAQRQSEYEILEWAAYKTSSEDLTPEEERLEFSLCLSHKPAIEKLVKETVPYNALFAYEQNVVPEQDRKSSHDASRSLAAPIELILRKLEQGQPACTLSSGSLLMDLSHLELVLQQINSLIAAMCSSPTERIRDLAQLFPKELLSLHSAAASDNLQRAPLLSPAHWVDKWAAYNPSWVGLEILDAISKDNTVSRTWTYRDLSHTSDQLCTWLAGHGWCNRSIAVCLDRSFMAYCLVLAIWKSGNCYVPIAEDLPVARQLFLLSDSGATAFFVDKWASKSLLSPENCEVIDIDGLELPGNPDVVDKISVNPKPSDDCYLLYTSGSTGTPKGVLVSRGNLSAFTEAQSEYICHEVPDTPGLKGTGSYLAHASRAFDVHICEMVLGWRHGLRLVTGQRDMLLDNLFLVLSCLKITHAGFVPSLLEHAEVSAESLPDLRYLGVGGENISETIIERFVGKQSIALINAYGPTEATIGFTSHTVKPWSTVRNIGTAVGNITIHVFEPETTKYTKRGQAGELCVTGDLVANGYHRRPNATGFTNLDGQRMYRTGDIVRLMANNCIEYLGRRDSQAKIRGQRLELEEVSIAVRRCARFPVQVTSMVTPSPITKRPQLVSFISPIGGRPYSTGVKVKFLKDRYQEWVPKILESCRIELPAYMVPSVLLPVSTIPVQISGKADKRHLVALYESIPISDLLLGPRETAMADLESISELDAAHLTAEQMKIRDILCTLVDADQKSVTKATNIFQLGIDSLDSLSVAAKLRRVGYVCSAADILGKSIAQLALLPRSYTIQDQGHRENFSEAQKTEASRRLEQLDQEFRNSQTQISNSCVAIVRPCLPLQESIVSTSIGSPIPLYVNHILCRLGKGITLKNLKLAFEDLMQHNEVLRTCFHIANNKIFQVVLKPRVVEIHWDEVVVSDENVARRLFNTRQTETASSIIRNIETKPPFHILAAFPVCEEEPGWFMLSIHHSIFDGASMGLLVKQLHHHYTGATSMSPADLTPLYRYMITGHGKNAQQFWSGYLSGYLPGIIEDEECNAGSYSIMTRTLPSNYLCFPKLLQRPRQLQLSLWKQHGRPC
ncbi:AMP-dependent synthetase/ligase [Penicillium atrosanguineum]|nr:AMP-dependent synthetase/ligase [Penicillium atrosanguineum]